MKIIRKIIKIDEELCDGCANCVPSCAEGAIEIIDGKAKIIGDKYCDGLGACMGECPLGALKITEREAEEFDEEAVLLKQRSKKNESKCFSIPAKKFSGPGDRSEKSRSGLGHWPIKIKLVPAGADFLKGSDLVIAADCAPVAYPSFQKNFIRGKSVIIGCPKFDNAKEYVQKLSRMFEISEIKSITSVIMEVPCCSGMSGIVKKALEKTERTIPFKEIVVSARGKILSSNVINS